MGFRYREDLTSADYAFDAEGGTLEELFRSSANALLTVMIEEPGRLKSEARREIWLRAKGKTEQAAESLLFDFLQKIVFFKDADALLLKVEEIRVVENIQGGELALYAVLAGEAIEPESQELGADVKGVTMHKFQVRKTQEGWQATVVLDT